MATLRLNDLVCIDRLAGSTCAGVGPGIFLYASSLRLQSRLESQLDSDDRASESRGDGTPRLGGVHKFHDHP